MPPFAYYRLPHSDIYTAIAQTSGEPERITSGTALLNLASAVAEAMTAASRGCPVHINVPLSEPLFDFSTGAQPDVKAVKLFRPEALNPKVLEGIAGRFVTAARPMLVAGQCFLEKNIQSLLDVISERFVVLHEPLGSRAVHFDEVISAIGNNPDYMPDFILYIGDAIVSKRLKKFLRAATGAETWAVSADGEIHDTFMNQTAVIEQPPENVLGIVAFYSIKQEKGKEKADPEAPLPPGERSRREFHARWQAALAAADSHAATFEPPYSQMMAVKLFESMLGNYKFKSYIHYANSSAVRLANIYANHYIYVNRGTNGIEGTLSTAAGFSIATNDMVFCIIGDLSFFYDNNALWNQCLRTNIHILLLNNGGGGIFHQLPGLEASPVRDKFIAAKHHSNACDLCNAHGFRYISAHNAKELKMHMLSFMFRTVNPVLYEVFTDAEEDARAVKEYYQSFMINQQNQT